MKIVLKIKLDAALVGEGPPLEFESEAARMCPVRDAWCVSFPWRECMIDPQLMEFVSVMVDGVELGNADVVEHRLTDFGPLVLKGPWPSGRAERAYA